MVLDGISLINLRFFGHNLRTRNARKSIKTSKDLYYSLVSNKSRVKKWLVGLASRAWSRNPNMHKPTHIMTSSTINTKFKYFQSFLIELQNFPHI